MSTRSSKLSLAIITLQTDFENEIQAKCAINSLNFSLKKFKQFLPLIYFVNLFRKKHHNEMCRVGQNLPYSSRKLSNIDKIWNAWCQRLWHQPSFWGVFRWKPGPVSHTVLISTGIRKAQSPASAAMKSSFITVSKPNNPPCFAELYHSRCGYFFRTSRRVHGE